MTTPTISIIMACYNAGQTVARAIDSMLVQTESRFEFLIVDDASHDQTPAILHHYEQTDARVRVLTNTTNRGPSYSLNRAIREARAPFIARMDADDSSLPERLARQLAFLNEHPYVDVLGTGAELVNTSGRLMGVVRLPSHHDLIVRQRYMRPLLIQPSVMFRRSFFDQCGFYDERLRRTEDLDLWLRTRHQATFANLPDLLFRYTYKPKITFYSFRSDIAVRFRHMRRSGELASRGYELVLCCLRFLLLYYTPYVPKSIRKPRTVV